MSTPAALLKRLESLENKIDLEGSRAVKAFIYHPEEDKPFWDPEPPEAWINAHPKGHAILLEVRDMSMKGL